MSQISIEFATEKDAEFLLELVKELAIYEKAEQDVATKTQDYRDGIRTGLFKALIAREKEGQIIGMALYYPVFSTWNGHTIYLEDFIVKEYKRGAGTGKMLFDRLLQEARLAGAKMLKWQVLDWNEPAKNFYRKYPVKFYPGWENGVIYFNK